MISVRFQGKPFSITVIQVYVPTTNAEKADWPDLWRPARLSRTNTKKRYLFHHRRFKCNNRKLRDIQNKKKKREIPRITRQQQTRVLWRELSDQNKHPFPNPKRQLYTWTSPDNQYWNQTDYVLCSQRWKSSTQQAKKDPELTVVQVMSSLLQNLVLNWRK